jgi:DNA-binding transcriptional ArsR family regulator
MHVTAEKESAVPVPTAVVDQGSGAGVARAASVPPEPADPSAGTDADRRSAGVSDRSRVVCREGSTRFMSSELAEAETDEGSTEELLDVLGDEHSRAILAAASDTPVSSKELTDLCDASPSTVYRRINDLLDRGLLDERVAFDGESKQTKVYETSFEHFDVSFDDGDCVVEPHECGQVASAVVALLERLPFEEVDTDLDGRVLTVRLSLTEDVIEELASRWLSGMSEMSGRFK